MFSKKESPKPQTNRVMAGMKFEGNLDITGDIRIDGIVIGMVRVEGKVVLGESGSITGDIFCDSADISGKVNGTLVVEEVLKIRDSSVIDGDILAGSLETMQGAEIDGKISIGEKWKESLEEEQDGQETISSDESGKEDTTPKSEISKTTGKPKRKYTRRNQTGNTSTTGKGSEGK